MQCATIAFILCHAATPVKGHTHMQYQVLLLLLLPRTLLLHSLLVHCCQTCLLLLLLLFVFPCRSRV
jgi:hypothetical protein